MCPTPAQKAAGIDGIINNANGSYQMFRPPPGQSTAAMSGNFAVRVAKQQPLAIPLSTLRDAARLFALTKDGTASITPISRWQFQPTYATYPPGVTLKFVAEQGQKYGGGGPGDDPAAGHVPAGLPAATAATPRGRCWPS